MGDTEEVVQPADRAERNLALLVEAELAGGFDSAPPGEHLIGYHASAIEPILRVAREVSTDDVFIDLGCGPGKVVLTVSALTGARARGIEVQPELVERARRAAERLDINAEFVLADARDADLDDGTVFYLYLPFTGPVLDRVLEKLHAIALLRPIVVCALGVDLERFAWLRRRELDEFWLAIYDAP